MVMPEPTEAPAAKPLSPEEFASQLDVPRETLDRLQVYVQLLREWQSRKNLVSPASLADVWRRHILDSAQLFPLLDEDDEVVDIGSGAGFPGLVLAIMGAQNVRLVESNQQKCAFLRAVAEATGTAVELWNGRLEELAAGALGGVADVVTARAVGPLIRLMQWIEQLIRSGACALILKDARADEEFTVPRMRW